ncbi:hypothetical protein, partial [Thalassospira xiamenensis]|uniref:hypothetical protein n=1 Tax=Thalassospira xiamenensis TaxID=220697 RepID=UPI00241C822B
MADYREISQIYAKSAINGVILVNGGGATALLTQASKFLELGTAQTVVWPLLIWTIGICLGVLTWVVAFISARYVDKSERESGLESKNLRLSDRYMSFGIILVLCSLGCFFIGALVLALQF